MPHPQQSHLIELPLHPTPDQALVLLRLSAAHRSTELLCMDQAFLKISGQNVALAALVGGLDHPDRTPAGEATALAATQLFAGCPPSALEYAIFSYQSRLRRCAVHNYGDLPKVGASRVVAGHGLVRPAGPGALRIDGVGTVRADLTRLPERARDGLWDGSTDDEAASARSEQGIEYSGHGYVEREWDGTDWKWTVELDFI